MRETDGVGRERQDTEKREMERGAREGETKLTEVERWREGETKKHNSERQNKERDGEGTRQRKKVRARDKT